MGDTRMDESYPVRVVVNNVSEPQFPAGQICATVAGNLSNMESPAAVHETDPDLPARRDAGAGWQS
jgi:hypothetical protein